MRNKKSNSKNIFPIHKNTSTPNDNNFNTHFMRRFKSQDLYSLSPQRKQDSNHSKHIITNKNNTNSSQNIPKKAANLKNNPITSTHNLSSSNSKSIMTSPKRAKDKINFNTIINSPKKDNEQSNGNSYTTCNNYLSNIPQSNIVIPLTYNILSDESIQELDTEENIHSIEDDQGKDHTKAINANLNYIESKKSKRRHNHTTKNMSNSNKIKIIDEFSEINSPKIRNKRKSVKECHITLEGVVNSKNTHISLEEQDNTTGYTGKQRGANNQTIDSLLKHFLDMAGKGDKEAFLNLFDKVISINHQLINYQNDTGFSALHYASDEGNLKIVDILIKGNAEVNIRTKKNKTPLHFSCQRGYFDISKLLIENGAMINVQDNDRNTPIHLCVLSQHIELLKYLLNKYPQADIKNINNKTPYELATNEKIQLILKDYLNKNENKYHKVRIHNAKMHQAVSMFSSEGNNNPSSPQRKTTKSNEFTPKSQAYKSKIVGNIIINKNSHTSTNKKKCNEDNNKSKSNTKMRNTINITTNTSNIGSIELLNQHHQQHEKSKGNVSGIEGEKGTNLLRNSCKTSTKGINLPSKRNTRISPGKKINQFLKSKTNIKVKFDLDNNSASKKTPLTILTTSPEIKNLHYKDYPCEIKIANVEIDLNDHLTENNQNNYNTTPLEESTKDDINNNNNNTDLKERFDDDTVSNNQSTNHNNSASIDDERITPSMFIIKGLLGKGSFGEVYLVEKKNTSTLFAMKVLNKDFIMGQNIVKYAMTERNILSLTSHPFIVKLNYAFQTIDQLFLILDYCPGGDLSKHLVIEKRFTEERAKIYLCEIILALGDLHQRDIVFRDLKPDNVVLDKDGHALLTDFGLSKEGVLDGNNTKSFCGSIAYLAPEMLKRKGHGKAVDWYLLGVLFYEMLIGIPPYFTNNKDQIFQNIEKGELQIPNFVSPQAQTLLRALLNRNIIERVGSKNDVTEIKEHEYFQDVNWNEVYERKLNPPKPQLNTFIQSITKPKQFNQDEDYNFKEDLATQSNPNNKAHFDGWSFIQRDNVNNTNNDNADNSSSQYTIVNKLNSDG